MDQTTIKIESIIGYLFNPADLPSTKSSNHLSILQLLTTGSTQKWQNFPSLAKLPQLLGRKNSLVIFVVNCISVIGHFSPYNFEVGLLEIFSMETIVRPGIFVRFPCFIPFVISDMCREMIIFIMNCISVTGSFSSNNFEAELLEIFSVETIVRPGIFAWFPCFAYFVISDICREMGLLNLETHLKLGRYIKGYNFSIVNFIDYQNSNLKSYLEREIPNNDVFKSNVWVLEQHDLTTSS